MAHGIDAAMNRMQSPAADAMPDAVLVEASAAKLRNGHDTVLSLGDLRHQNVWLGEVVAHIATKAPSPADSPCGWG
jgi:hypothetical protein